MASPMVTGPVLIYVGLSTSDVTELSIAVTPGSATSGGSGSPGGTGFGTSGNNLLVGFTANIRALVTSSRAYFLGTGEYAPNRRLRHHYSEVKNDLSGPILPFDKIRAGQDALVSVALTRWNPPVYRAIASASNSGVLGFESSADRGTLMVSEGQSFPLFLVHPFFTTHPAMRAQGLVPGYRFFAAMIEGDDDEEPGTKANKEHLMFYCQSAYDVPTGNFGLFDFNVGGLPIIPPN